MATRQSLGDIFLGITPKAIRDYMQAAFAGARNAGYRKVVIPCAGRFTVVEAAVGAGWSPSDILTSDISMFSSVVGYHMAGRPITDLGITFHDEFDDLQQWLAGERAAAAVLVALKVAQLRDDKYFERIVRDDVLKRFEDAVFYINPPSFAKGYAKMFDTKGRITWADPQIPEFDSKSGRQGIYDKMLPAKALAFIFRGRQMDEGMEDFAVFAAEGNKRIDFVLANRPTEARAIVKRRPETKIGSAHIPFLPDGYEITPDSVITYREVTKGQALYYRDLFAHKLWVTRAERYFVALIDGYLMAVFGMFFSEVQRGMSGKVYEVFGFCCPNGRYPRLNRLFMTSIVCDDARKAFQTACSGALRDVDYFQTTCLSTTPEQKVHRGSLKLISRETMDDGRFKLVYGGKFKSWGFRKVIENWLDRMRNIEKETGKPMGVGMMPNPEDALRESSQEAA